jgi:hypothetical protein
MRILCFILSWIPPVILHVLNPIKADFAANSALLNGHAEGNLRVAYADSAGVANSLAPGIAEDILDRVPSPPLASEGYDGEISDNGWAKLPNGLIIQWGKTPHLIYELSSV